MKIYELYELSVEHKDLSLDHFSIENIGNIFNSLENISERYSIEDETEAEQQNKTSSTTVRRTGFAKVITNVVWFFQRAYTFFVELIRKFRIWLASKSIKRAIGKLNSKSDINYKAVGLNKRTDGVTSIYIDRNIVFLLAYFHPEIYRTDLEIDYVATSSDIDEELEDVDVASLDKNKIKELESYLDDALYYETMIKKYIASVCSKKEGTFEFEKRPGVSRKYKEQKLSDGRNRYEFESSTVMSDIKARIQEITKLVVVGVGDSKNRYSITGDTIKAIANNLLDYLKKYGKLSSTMCNKLKELRLSRIGDENYRNYVMIYKGFFSKIQKFIRAEMETGFLCVKALNKLVKRVLVQDRPGTDNMIIR